MKTIIELINESQNNEYVELYNLIEDSVAKYGDNDAIDTKVAKFRKNLHKSPEPNEPRFLIKTGSSYEWNRFRHLVGDSKELKKMHYEPIGIIFGESFLRINEKTYDELYKEFKAFFEKHGDDKKL